jgi:hypothetical protein
LPNCLDYGLLVPVVPARHRLPQTPNRMYKHNIHAHRLPSVACLPLFAEDSGSELIDQLGQLLAERPYDEFDLVDKLREKGWVLPAYSLAPNAKYVHNPARTALPAACPRMYIQLLLPCSPWQDLLHSPLATVAHTRQWACTVQLVCSVCRHHTADL